MYPSALLSPTSGNDNSASTAGTAFQTWSTVAEYSRAVPVPFADLASASVEHPDMSATAASAMKPANIFFSKGISSLDVFDMSRGMVGIAWRSIKYQIVGPL